MKCVQFVGTRFCRIFQTGGDTLSTSGGNAYFFKCNHDGETLHAININICTLFRNFSSGAHNFAVCCMIYTICELCTVEILGFQD